MKTVLNRIKVNTTVKSKLVMQPVLDHNHKTIEIKVHVKENKKQNEIKTAMNKSSLTNPRRTSLMNAKNRQETR